MIKWTFLSLDKEYEVWSKTYHSACAELEEKGISNYKLICVCITQKISNNNTLTFLGK